ncbi:sialate O-acetylesterase, partial [Escherichia coli]|nr:sialate O-acetylesterase [Escherichia coli]
LTRGGVVSCRFKLEGTLTESQYAFGLYLVIPADALPDGVTLAESGGTRSNACLLAFFVSTDATNINLAWHQKSAVSVGTYGAFDNDWHTLELRFAGNNSTDVIPVLDGTAGASVTLTKTASNTEENVFTVTDITTGATYSTLFEYVTVDVNAEESATA